MSSFVDLKTFNDFTEMVAYNSKFIVMELTIDINLLKRTRMKSIMLKFVIGLIIIDEEFRFSKTSRVELNT